MVRMKCKAYCEVDHGIGYAPCPNCSVSFGLCNDHFNELNSIDRFEKIDDIYCISKIGLYIKTMNKQDEQKVKIACFKGLLDFVIQHQDFLERNDEFKGKILQKINDLSNIESAANLIDLNYYKSLITPKNEPFDNFNFTLNDLDNFKIVVNI